MGTRDSLLSQLESVAVAKLANRLEGLGNPKDVPLNLEKALTDFSMAVSLKRIADAVERIANTI